MSRTLEYVLACYRTLLWLYPPELRRAYGNDMTDVFNQLLRTEWTRRGMRGVIGAACRAIGEIFTIAIPGHLVTDWAIAAGLSLLINSAILALLVGIMMRPVHRFQ